MIVEVGREGCLMMVVIATIQRQPCEVGDGDEGSLPASTPDFPLVLRAAASQIRDLPS